jgi:hypothetical protein
MILAISGASSLFIFFVYRLCSSSLCIFSVHLLWASSSLFIFSVHLLCPSSLFIFSVHLRFIFCSSSVHLFVLCSSSVHLVCILLFILCVACVHLVPMLCSSSVYPLCTLKAEILQTRIELVTLCVLGTRDNQLHHRSRLITKQPKTILDSNYSQ